MRRKRILLLLLTLISVFVNLFSLLADDTISIGTYYPSPYGVYNEVQLYPHSAPSVVCGSNTAGTMFFNSTDRELKVCDGAGNWVGSANGSFWASSGNDIYNINSGNVGMGVMNPSAKLEVNGSILFNGVTEGYNGGITIPNSDLTVGGGSDGIFSIRSRNSGAQVITFGNQTSGAGGARVTLGIDNLNRRVGIGTYSPSAPLHLYGNPKMKLQSDANPNNYSDIHFDNTPSGGKEYVIGNYGNNYSNAALRNSFFIRDNSDGEKFIIAPSGNTGFISTDSDTGPAVQPQALLHIKRQNGIDTWVETNDPDIKFVDLQANWDTMKMGMDLSDGSLKFTRNQRNTANPNVEIAELMRFTKNGKWGIGVANPSHAIDVSGGAYCTGSAWKVHSDRELKENIDYNFKYGLKTVGQLKPVSYVYKDDPANKQQIGLIAQDVKEVIPELVEGEEGAYGLNYGQLTVVLINTIKEQQEEIRDLQRMTKMLKEKLNSGK